MFLVFGSIHCIFFVKHDSADTLSGYVQDMSFCSQDFMSVSCFIMRSQRGEMIFLHEKTTKWHIHYSSFDFRLPFYILFTLYFYCFSEATHLWKVKKGTDCVVCVLVVFIYLLFFTSSPVFETKIICIVLPLCSPVSHSCYQKVVPHCCLISFTAFISRFG